MSDSNKLEVCPNCGKEMVGGLLEPHPGSAIKNCGDCESRFKFNEDSEWIEIESGKPFSDQM